MKPQFDEFWTILLNHQGETFYTVRKLPFTYQIIDDCFVSSRPAKMPKVPKDMVKQAYEMWPVEAPVQFSENGILAPSYLFGVMNDKRIIS